MTDLGAGLSEVKNNIAHFEQRYGRDPGSVKLIAVSKTKPASAIRAAYELGERRFGENYLQEAIEKQTELAGLVIEWHFIGHIQSRKARLVSENFNWVHCVDRIKVARKLSVARPAELGVLNVLIQLNLQGEESKSGVAADEVSALAKEIKALPNLALRGLMLIPEPEEKLGKQRAVFAQAKTLMQALNRQGHDLTELSMGMTGDLEAAIAEGATMVRIGTAIFGAREVKAAAI